MQRRVIWLSIILVIHETIEVGSHYEMLQAEGGLFEHILGFYGLELVQELIHKVFKRIFFLCIARWRCTQDAYSRGFLTFANKWVSRSWDLLL